MRASGLATILEFIYAASLMTLRNVISREISMCEALPVFLDFLRIVHPQYPFYSAYTKFSANSLDRHKTIILRVQWKNEQPKGVN